MLWRHKISGLDFFALVLVIFLITNTSTPVFGADEAELRDKIDSSSSEIKKLEQEIANYQTKLNTVKTKSTNLQGEINRIDLTKKKLDTDVKLTTKKIENTKFLITKLSGDIETSSSQIDKHKQSIEESLRVLNVSEQNKSLVTLLLEHETLSAAIKELNDLNTLQQKLLTDIKDLRNTKQEFEIQKTDSEQEQKKLAGLQEKIVDQKKIVEGNIKEKSVLLAQTKSTESSYQKLLADTLARKKQVEDEIRRAEEALNLIVNPSSLPTTGKGVLAWPLDKITITQYFGNTPFATTNPQIYNGKGHNGMDFGASMGTPIKAVHDGVVLGVGDTDLTCPKASYGKWVMVKHVNGVSSVSAHLSLAKVTEGEVVKRGQIIAYSGNSGYTTGPHLHFTLFASDGSQVGTLKSSVPGCGTYRIPLGTRESLLNPLSYF